MTTDEDTGKLKVRVPPLRQLTKKPKRIAPGHGACPGCGIFSGLELFFKGIEGDIVALYPDRLRDGRHDGLSVFRAQSHLYPQSVPERRSYAVRCRGDVLGAQAPRRTGSISA